MSITSTTRPLLSGPGLSPASLDRLHALLWEAREHEVAEMLACRALIGGVGLSGVLERELGVDAGRRAIADIDQALARLGAGTYGACEQCGAAISLERLTALPRTRSCGLCRHRRGGFRGETTPSR